MGAAMHESFACWGGDGISMLGRVKPVWVLAWFKQDKLWMKQGQARGFASTAGATALSGCNEASPEWKGKQAWPWEQAGAGAAQARG